MMFCVECGQKLNDDAKFCSNCGKPQMKVAGVNAGQERQQAEDGVKVGEPQTKKPFSFFKKKEPVSCVLPDTVEDSMEAESSAISSDGKYLAVLKTDESYDSYLEVTDTQSKKEVHTFNLEYSPYGNGVLAVCSAGNLVVTGHTILRDVQKETEICNLSHSNNTVSSFAFSPDSKRLAYMNDCDLEVLNTQNGNKLISISGKDKGFFNQGRLAYSHDGRYFAVTSTTKSCVILDARNGSELCKLVSSSIHKADSIAFSYDGKCVVALHRKAIRLFDTQKGNMLLQIGEEEDVERGGAICFSPDDRIIAAGYGDGVIQFYNPETGELLKQLQGDKTGIEWLSYTPDGKTLISYSSQTVKFWVGE
jgi:WD40 repeat protein